MYVQNWRNKQYNMQDATIKFTAKHQQQCTFLTLAGKPSINCGLLIFSALNASVNTTVKSEQVQSSAKFSSTFNVCTRGSFFSYAYCCWQPLNVELHDAQSRTYGLKAQVGVIGEVLRGEGDGDADYLPPTRGSNVCQPLKHLLVPLTIPRVKTEICWKRTFYTSESFTPQIHV